MNGSMIVANEAIIIGDDCMIGGQCRILDSDFHGIEANKRRLPGITKPVIISDNVFTGLEVMVLKGVHVGKDAVIGARCVVTKDVPCGAIVAGNPIRIIGSVYSINTSNKIITKEPL
jgi:acetyltransferase-like isoleucine patch superfamily enzyme